MEQKNMRREETFEVNRISEQVRRIRTMSDIIQHGGIKLLLTEAADTIEDLSEKLAAVNIERLDGYCGEEKELIEEMAEEIENCYGRETELSERAREYLLKFAKEV